LSSLSASKGLTDVVTATGGRPTVVDGTVEMGRDAEDRLLTEFDVVVGLLLGVTATVDEALLFLVVEEDSVLIPPTEAVASLLVNPDGAVVNRPPFCPNEEAGFLAKELF
jgi:hypothetical protein